MNTDLVSVIMPAFNAENYIQDAIDSVTRQTYTHWELIIIDDGSTDRTAVIVKDHLIRDNRVKYFYQDNEGQGAARNNGLRNSQGKYIAFLDADDIWLPEKLRVQVEIMFANKVDLVFSDAYVFEDKPVGEKTLDIPPGYYQGEEAVRKFLFCNYIPILTVLAKRSALESVNGFSELRNIHEDYDLWIRLLINGSSLLGIDSPLAYYRSHPGSSSGGEGKMLFFTINSLQHIKGKYPKYSVDINRSLYDLINEYLNKISFRKWDVAKQFLLARNQIANDKVSVSFWKTVHTLLGGRIFRVLLIWRYRFVHRKMKEEDIRLETLVF